jgi:murein L,D-transpeptidase YafK
MPKIDFLMSSGRSYRRFSYTVALAGFLLSFGLSPARADDKPSPGADWEKYATPKADKILVYKSERKMELLRGDTVLRTYHIALGHHPSGKKIQAGDGRTPEGSYTIDRRKIMSDYHLALHISYPDAYDMRQAAAKGLQPGGGIMIHGQPNYMTPGERARLGTDWTAGCIALTNPEIDEVWRLVDDGTTVDIYP